MPGAEPAYAVLGRGRWAGVMHEALRRAERRTQAVPDVRRAPAEPDERYVARVGALLRRSAAQVAWLCVPPGPHVDLLVGCALDAGMDCVVEKPWPISPNAAARLSARAAAEGRVVALHVEYCLLDGVTRWRERPDSGEGRTFSGRFLSAGPDRLGLAALDNLGCHLLAVREYAAARSALGSLECGYLAPAAARQVRLAGGPAPEDVVDFLGSDEPIIQRFVAVVEDGRRGAPVPFDARFAARVAAALDSARAAGEGAPASPATP